MTISKPLDNDITRSIKLLWIIDDDSMTSFFASSILKRALSVEQVDVFNYAVDALVALKNLYYSAQSLPDIILLDSNMPQMDGFEFLQEVKNQQIDLNPTQIYLHTGSDDMESRVKAKKAAIPLAGYIVKPLDKMQIHSLLQEPVAVYA